MNLASRFSTTVILVLITVPTTITALKNNYLPARPPARISKAELAGLRFLLKQPNGVVLTYPFDTNARYGFSEPRPVFAYASTAYVSALSEKVTFLEDEVNLGITNQDFQPRLKEEKNFFGSNDRYWAKSFLVQNKIRYIYLLKSQKINLNMADLSVEEIFENEEVSIYRVSW